MALNTSRTPRYPSIYAIARSLLRGDALFLASLPGWLQVHVEVRSQTFICGWC